MRAAVSVLKNGASGYVVIAIDMFYRGERRISVAHAVGRRYANGRAV